MSETKRFATRTVLTVTTGRLLTEPRGEHDNGIGDLYEILGWMTGDSPYTHQLGRFSDECKPWLLKQHPCLEAITDDDIAEIKTCGGEAWLVKMYELRGLPRHLDIAKIPPGNHERKDPIAEYKEMRGGK